MTGEDCGNAVFPGHLKDFSLRSGIELSPAGMASKFPDFGVQIGCR